MIIDVDPRREDAKFQLLDMDVFHALKLVIHTENPNTDPSDAAADLGEWNGSHIFIKPEKLCELAGKRALDLAWTKKLDSMVAYAISSGWADDEGALRLHVEYIQD